MSPEDRVRLRHIADALDAAIRFAEGRKREDLDRDEMLAFALVHALQIAGEAAGRLSAETRNQRPEVPWASMIGMRHRLVHAYFDINLDILWTTRRRGRSGARGPDTASSQSRLTPEGEATQSAG